MKLFIRTILLGYLTLFVSVIESSDLSKTIEDSNSKSKSYCFNKSEIFNQLFNINYYDKIEMHNERKNLTLIKSVIDTSYSFNSPINEIHISEDIIPNYLRSIGKFKNDRNKTGMTEGYFYLQKIISVDSSNFIGVYVEYFGWERICYAYGKITLVDDNYYLDTLFKNLDISGIGGYKYEPAYNLGNNNYYIISLHSQEGHTSVNLHYLPNNFNNTKEVLDSCLPADYESPHDEKMNYIYNYEKENIIIKKYELDRDPKSNWINERVKESDWELVSTIDLQLKFIVKKLEKEAFVHYRSKTAPNNKRSTREIPRR